MNPSPVTTAPAPQAVGARCYLCGREGLTACTTQLRHGPGTVWYCASCELGMLGQPPSDNLKAYYDDIYRRRHGPVLNQPSSYREIFDAYVPHQAPRIELLRPWLTPTARVLEVGCSTGQFLYHVKPLVREVVGVDYDSGAARFAAEICQCTTFGCGLEEANLAPASFDVVCAIHTLEHARDPVEFARMLGRHLKPGGVVYVEVPNLRDPLLSVYPCAAFRSFYFQEAHLFYFSPASLTAAMIRAGFEGAIRCRQDYHFVNHLHWLLLGKPQTSSHEAVGSPKLSLAEQADPALRRELARWLEAADRQYKALLVKHGYADNLIFLGRLREATAAAAVVAPPRVTEQRPSDSPEEGHGVQRLSLATHAAFGIDARLTLPVHVAAFGFTRPSAVIDEAVAALPSTEDLLRAWEDAGLRFVKMYRARSTKEPDYDYLDQVAAEFRGLDTDVLVGIGGGSALDLAKGVGVLLRNPGAGITYRGMDQVASPGVPVILLPTTAGSGSEVTATASFIDRKTKSKLGINGRYVDCLMAILDPVLLTSCPASVTVGSGLDALVHAIEAVTATTANPISTLFGIEAARLMVAGLPEAVAEPGNVEARARTLLGSHYAGMAMRNAGGGPASGISYPLGSHYGVPHGFAGGILLPHVVALNVARGAVDGYARLYERLDGADPLAGDAAKAEAFRDVLWDLCHRVGAPATLTRWGLTRDAVPPLADLTVAQRKLNLDCNPVPCRREDVVALLEAVTEPAPAGAARQ